MKKYKVENDYAVWSTYDNEKDAEEMARYLNDRYKSRCYVTVIDEEQEAEPMENKMKLIKGGTGYGFKYGETVEIEHDGRIIKRKVRYDSLNGLYVVIDNEKISYKALKEGAE